MRGWICFQARSRSQIDQERKDSIFTVGEKKHLPPADSQG